MAGCYEPNGDVYLDEIDTNLVDPDLDDVLWWSLPKSSFAGGTGVKKSDNGEGGKRAIKKSNHELDLMRSSMQSSMQVDDVDGSDRQRERDKNRMVSNRQSTRYRSRRHVNESIASDAFVIDLSDEEDDEEDDEDIIVKEVVKKRRKRETFVKSKKVEKLNQSKKSRQLKQVEFKKTNIDIEIDFDNEDKESGYSAEKPIVVKNMNEIKSINTKDYENIELDESAITLEDLCSRVFSIGRKSKNFDLAEQARKDRINRRKNKNRNANKDQQEDKGGDDIKTDGEDGQNQTNAFDLLDPQLNEYKVENAKEEDRLTIKKDKDGDMKLKIVNGVIQIEEEKQIFFQESNCVQEERIRQLKRDTKFKIVDHENPFENILLSNAFTKSDRTKTLNPNLISSWSIKETIKFYKALSSYGTDFQLIAQLFPNKTREKIKGKYSVETRRNPELVEFSLNNKSAINVKQYFRDVNENKAPDNLTHFKTLAQFNDELRKLREDNDRFISKLERKM
ncbi:uncharacterized protein ASCRUDRAFT_70111 [Ascoidea rubescens DSM 1968]|uniref:Myb-like domain-containing protein n=1 Tax=Ascoidea rubescens DSM 1968 TaxID=1344418 RepID=A0A1D2VJ35_9ASCO|nr:hypothetical protein ASCRUDRAFT_70111 [Ascoidea rubescens DSM 1968]ODV61641.1 hypothetical protein ASCRUDRAFT_70111 [Ascoidea rubescens DSM 1968]